MRAFGMTTAALLAAAGCFGGNGGGPAGDVPAAGQDVPGLPGTGGNAGGQAGAQADAGAGAGSGGSPATGGMAGVEPPMSGGQGGGGGSVGQGGGGPAFLSFNTNSPSLRSDGTLRFTAVLTDPDGIDDLIGGSLVDPDTGATYGAFATDAGEGAYSLTLTWSEIQMVRGIDADPAPAGVDRIFRAEFFDQAGNRSTQDLSIKLMCESDVESACDGLCVNLQTSGNHCGACDRAITESDQICEGGAPACYSSDDQICEGICVDVTGNVDSCGDCARACPAIPAQFQENTDPPSERLCIGDRCGYTLVSTTHYQSCTQMCAAAGKVCEQQSGLSAIAGRLIIQPEGGTTTSLVDLVQCDDPATIPDGYVLQDMICYRCLDP